MDARVRTVRAAISRNPPVFTDYPSSHSLPPPPTRAVAGAGQLRGKKATARAGKSTRAASLLLDSAMQIAVQRDDYAQFWRASSPNLRVVPATDQQRWRVKEKKKEKKVSWQRKQKKKVVRLAVASGLSRTRWLHAAEGGKAERGRAKKVARML